MTTLDGKKRTLTADMLVIADAECAEDIGGVMGGASSEISNSTTRIVFEAAYFTPAQIRSTSRTAWPQDGSLVPFRAGRRSHRSAAGDESRRSSSSRQIGAGTPEGNITDVYPSPYQPKTMQLNRARIGGLLGMDVPDDAVERILTSLGFEVSTTHDSRPKTSEGWNVIPPPWRVDMHRQVDLIEEVGRHYGFEHLPATFPGVEQAPPPSDSRIARDRRVRTALLGMGFSEAITFAFIEAAAAEPYPRVGAGRRSRSPIRCPRSSPSCGRACCRVSSTCSATIGATGGLTSASSRSARASRRRVNPAARRSHGWGSARPITGAAPGGRWISPTSRVSSSNSRRSRRFPSPSRRSNARSSCADARRTS